MRNKAFGATVAILIQLITALSVLPVPTDGTPAEIGTITTFANGDSAREFLFWERGEDTSLNFRCLRTPRSSTPPSR